MIDDTVRQWRSASSSSGVATRIVSLVVVLLVIVAIVLDTFVDGDTSP